MNSPHRTFLHLSLLSLFACGDDAPTGVTAGEQMSVPEQVAIEAALGKVVSAFEATEQRADSNLADWTRIAARLIRLQGRRGDLDARIELGGPATTRSMHAVSMLITERSGTTVRSLHYLIAWSGLDAQEFTVRDAIVVLVDGGGAAPSGSFPLSGAAGTARYIDLREAVGPYSSVEGSLNVGDERFGGDCPGLANQPGTTCATGRERVGGSFRAVRSATPASVNVSWDARVLPAFKLEVRDSGFGTRESGFVVRVGIQDEQAVRITSGSGSSIS